MNSHVATSVLYVLLRVDRQYECTGTVSLGSKVLIMKFLQQSSRPRIRDFGHVC
jgi:hypothetical protein